MFLDISSAPEHCYCSKLCFLGVLTVCAVRL